MFGDNPIRPALQHDGSVLDVKALFATIQGEGPNMGTPSVFVRLGGCNLACRFCDTVFEEYTSLTLAEITTEVERLSLDAGGIRARQLVVITGGEPLRQNIIPLCHALIEKGFTVQIETNGTLWRELPHAVQIVCSPKNTGKGYAPLRGDLLQRVQALKFLISASDASYRDVPDVGQETYDTPVYVQAMDEYNDEKNAANLARTVALAQSKGYRLSLQLHKWLGIE